MTIDTVKPSTNEILKDQLYLGNLSAAQCREHMTKLGITHVVSVCHECPPAGGAAKTHLHVSVEDTEYEDLLIHLPKTSRFIQGALEDGGRVLVHCVMGVSRSTTVVAAFLMKYRKMDARSALRYIKQRRPQVHPNYGFIKQLDTYAKCQFEPSPSNPVYRSWKKRQEQDVTYFLNQLVDTVSIISDKLLLNRYAVQGALDVKESIHGLNISVVRLFADSNLTYIFSLFHRRYPLKSAESLLADLGITHVLSISPAEIPPSALSAGLKSKHHHHHINIRNSAKEDLLLALPGAVQFLEEAMTDGLVLVHSLMEVRACTVACACLMKQRSLAPDEAFSAIEDALPLFNPTVNFSRNLELYDACGYQPTRDHPVVQEWLSPDRPESEFDKPQFRRLSSVINSNAYRPSPLPSPSPSLQQRKDFFTSAKGTPTVTSGSPLHTQSTPSPSRPPTTHKRVAPSSNGGNTRNAKGSPQMDLGASARDILSETGFDLAGFADTLKEIEKSHASGKSRRNNGNGSRKDSFDGQRKQKAAPSLYC